MGEDSYCLLRRMDSVVALGDVYQLEVHRERSHDPAELHRAHSLYACFEPLVEFRVVVEAEPLAEQPDLLLRPEHSLALLLDDYLPQNAPKQVYVAPQRLVLRLESHPRWEIREG